MILLLRLQKIQYHLSLILAPVTPYPNDFPPYKNASKSIVPFCRFKPLKQTFQRVTEVQIFSENSDTGTSFS